MEPANAGVGDELKSASTSPQGHAHIVSVKVEVDGRACRGAVAVSGRSSLALHIGFASDPVLPCPCVGFTLHATDGRTLTSAATWEDELTLYRELDGAGQVSLVFDRLPLLKGEYLLSVHLLCERGLHIYDSANAVANLQVQQEGRLQGYFMMPHSWK